MASLGAIRTAVKTTLETISGLRCYDKIPAVVHVPAVVVEPAAPADFDVAMGRGTDTYLFDLHVIVADADEIVGQAQLDEYVTGAGDKSIRAVVFAAKTLGLTHTDAHVSAMTAYGVQFELARPDHIGATLRLVVHTKGTE